MLCRLLFVFSFFFYLQCLFLSCVCSASSLWGLLLYDIRICSSLSGSWAVSRAWRPYWMRVEAAESERHCEDRGECVCMKASEEDWWKLTNIKNPREKEGVCSKTKNRRSSLALSKYVKLNEDANSNTPYCFPWRATVMSLKCVCSFTVIMAFSPSITVEMYFFSIRHFPWIWYKIRTETLKNMFFLCQHIVNIKSSN